ncbi:hypothetical protein IE81DRAFT_345028 [Ceraceosorus guamensis]|uniref:MPN domain-containing protein n=1 Tax=Ceraceosorus guamensis TaxID=1522189 RepID=A0A316W4S6_9BASI|nr:hypothetical protein IE81DRAFT_345028 [Ceraceosorus guamensis]PWN44957.1 hypothetical protein IE81DRAFT_345028 [Ceraceosorus guamensis]
MAPPIPSSFRPREAGAEPLDGVRPRSIAQLAQVAASPPHTVHISNDVPLKRYVGGAASLAKQASIDESEGRVERSFVNLIKCAKLLLELIPKHAEYRSIDARMRKSISEDAQRTLDDISRVKMALAGREEQWMADPEAFEARARKVRSAASQAPSSSALQTHQQEVAHADRTAQAQGERTSQAASKPDTQARGASDGGIEFHKPERGGFDVRDILGWVKADQTTDSSQDAYAQLARHVDTRPRTREPEAHRAQLAYPTLRPSHSIRMAKHQTNQGFAPSSDRAATYFQTTHSTAGASVGGVQMPLPRPTDDADLAASALRAIGLGGSSSSSAQTAMSYPSVAASNHSATRRLRGDEVERQALALASRRARAPKTHTEGGEELRSIFVPSSLISRFVSLAESNTTRNIETCGLLMGRLYNDAFTVSHLTIPKQRGTTDSCDTEDEEGIWEFQMKEDLISMGWIHTHPSFSCFLSSRDLHTHSTFQALMPEAVAIVCAPNAEPNVGIFRLTDPPGLKTIIACRAPAEFHPHVSSDGTALALYTDVSHVILEEGTALTVTDLRR